MMARGVFRYSRDVPFLILIYFLGVWLRLVPRLGYDPHLLTFNADIWYRLSLAQYFSDYGCLPQFSLRYLAYGRVPCWYPPLAPIFFSVLSRISALDLPTVCSRLIPFFEALAPLPFFFLARYLYGKGTAIPATIILSLTASFVYWSGIATPQSLTLFLLPIYLLLLVFRSEERHGHFWKIGQRRAGWILGLSSLLAVNHLAHPTYFLAVAVLLLFAAGLKIERRLRPKAFLDLVLAVALSQVLTLWWWAPKNLYWWWIKALVTSSMVKTSPFQQLINYGITAAGLGLFALLFFIFIRIFRRRSGLAYLAPLLLWSGAIFLETQNQAILELIRRPDLSWSPIFKPLEGFRFYPFLAQPLSLLSALVIAKYDSSYRQARPALRALCLSILVGAMLWDVYFIYRLPQRWANSGITMADYRAAVWFRGHSRPDERIITDYYRAQMFAGVTAGDALLGSLFPLRNVDLPYIKNASQVRDDIYTIYATESAYLAYNLMRKYGATHLYIFKNIETTGGFGSSLKDGFGVNLNREKFKNGYYFEQVYNEAEQAVIVKAKGLQIPRSPGRDGGILD